MCGLFSQFFTLLQKHILAKGFKNTAPRKHSCEKIRETVVLQFWSFRRSRGDIVGERRRRKNY
jgi:hypothetical protein